MLSPVFIGYTDDANNITGLRVCYGGSLDVIAPWVAMTPNHDDFAARIDGIVEKLGWDIEEIVPGRGISHFTTNPQRHWPLSHKNVREIVRIHGVERVYVVTDFDFRAYTYEGVFFTKEIYTLDDVRPEVWEGLERSFR